MASDDFVRIIYRPKREVHTAPASKAPVSGAKARRNRTSVSIEPDLYHTFVIIVGDAVQARNRIRQWATDSDMLRSNAGDNTGVSRLVHKQMLAVIRRVVEAGLIVIRQGGEKAVHQLLEVRIEDSATPARATRAAKATPAAPADGKSGISSDASPNAPANGTAMADAIQSGDSGAAKPAEINLDDWDSFAGAGAGAAAAAVIKKAAGGTKVKKTPNKKGKSVGVDPFAPVAIPITDVASEDLSAGGAELDAGAGGLSAVPVVPAPAAELALVGVGSDSFTDDVAGAAGRTLPPQREDYTRERFPD